MKPLLIWAGFEIAFLPSVYEPLPLVVACEKAFAEIPSGLFLLNLRNSDYSYTIIEYGSRQARSKTGMGREL